MKAEEILRNCTVKVWPNVYSVIKAKYAPDDYIAVIKDFNETTVIIEPNKIPSDCIIMEEAGWKILTFEAELSFELVGFLSIITQKLAEASISIFALSSFSTDHLMVKANKLNDAVEVLKRLGCTIET